MNKVTGKSRDSGFLWIVVPFILFSLAGLIIQLTGSNQALFYQCNRISQWTGPALWANLTILGDFMILLALMLPLIRKRPDVVWSLLLAALIGMFLIQTLKTVTHISRPARILESESFIQIGRVLTRRSFPSGHTASIFTFTGILILMQIKQTGLRLLLLSAALITGLSRIAVGVHWPLDVCTGAAAGLFSAWCGMKLAGLTSWGSTRTGSLIWGAVLLVTALVLLLFYQTGYPDAVIFQRGIAVICFLWGIRDYIKILRNHEIRQRL